MELHRAAVTVSDVAVEVGRSVAHISNQLTGSAPLSDLTVGAMRRLAGDRVADRVVALVAEEPVR